MSAFDRTQNSAFENYTTSSYYLFAKMESLKNHGTFPVKTIQAGASGTDVKLDKLELQPSHRITGRVVLSDDRPVPAKTRMHFGREKAWDYTEVTLDKDGKFVIEGVPSESISLSVRIKGYKLSKKNPSLDWLNGGIVGRVAGDTELTLLLEPGEWKHNEEREDMPSGADSQPREKPLRGVKL